MQRTSFLSSCECKNVTQENLYDFNKELVSDCKQIRTSEKLALIFVGSGNALVECQAIEKIYEAFSYDKDIRVPNEIIFIDPIYASESSETFGLKQEIKEKLNLLDANLIIKFYAVFPDSRFVSNPLVNFRLEKNVNYKLIGIDPVFSLERSLIDPLNFSKFEIRENGYLSAFFGVICAMRKAGITHNSYLIDAGQLLKDNNVTDFIAKHITYKYIDEPKMDEKWDGVSMVKKAMEAVATDDLYKQISRERRSRRNNP